MLGMGKKSRQLVGLDIGSSSIKAVELKATKKRVDALWKSLSLDKT